ncbi:FapA family protein [Gracilibacillus caseinilyticus]|uniref:FapA family protein n=1 Tax=Gracilibacillus caseinilyticus TaxID=2932256 RepID=A0ABY4EUV8_9BACI|nr:FapA family protein [Gracilibacillus caseinilyticus]UOQ47851.1 FapA family protein [Gracilibacillus caseinilyticus]
MSELKENIVIKVSHDRLSATLLLKKSELVDTLTFEEMQDVMNENNITYGILDLNKINWKKQLKEEQMIVIAKGKKPVDGEDGKLLIRQSTENELEEEEKSSFRDVHKIPMVEENDLLAQVVPPTDGEAGMDVFEKTLRPKRGKPLPITAGQNVTFDKEQLSYFASAAGQLSIANQVIQVHPLYEVNGDLSLKTGNIEFNGSVSIKGNVPSGYRVKAKGDIIVYGIVEGSFLSAEGNITIREGIAGMDKAKIHAAGDIEVAYINQAEVTAGRDLKVKKSIMQSHCEAQENIFCPNGNIIGGSCSAGKIIELKNLGNMANLKTVLSFGVSKKILDRVNILNKKRQELEDNKQKLRMLGDQLIEKKKAVGDLPAKERIMLLKQRNMLQLTTEQLQQVADELSELQFEVSNFSGLKLIVKGRAFDNVELIFGKYKRLLSQEHVCFEAFLDEKEIVIQSSTGK